MSSVLSHWDKRFGPLQTPPRMEVFHGTLSPGPTFGPRNHRVLRVIGITRISTLNQDPKKPRRPAGAAEEWVEDRYDGSVEWKFISGQGSGECLDRQQVAETEDLVATGQYDLIIMEDLGRHLRRMQAFLFCEACEDTETRLVAINDNIDTAHEWRLIALFAAMKHEQSNRTPRFGSDGAFGIALSKGAWCSALYLDTSSRPVRNRTRTSARIRPPNPSTGVFRRLDSGANFSEIADWLNASGVSPGPYCRRKEWNGQMVVRLTYNPILKGVRVRNRVKSKRPTRPANTTASRHLQKSDWSANARTWLSLTPITTTA